MKRSLKKIVVGSKENACNRLRLLAEQPLRQSQDHGNIRGPINMMAFLNPRKDLALRKITWRITTLLFLLFSEQAFSNPLPKQGQAVNSNMNVSPSYHPPNRFVPLSIVNSHNESGTPASKYLSVSPSSSEEGQVLVEPSKMTFELKHPFCKEDVSLARITCRNVKRREDLPDKQTTFEAVQQAIFVNISGSDIRLEHIKILFPNLIVLGITESPGFAASLINLQATSMQQSSSQFGRWENMVPKSLLQDPYFAKRIRLNQLSGMRPTLSALGVVGSGTGTRGQRALDPSTTTTTTTTTVKTTTTFSTSARPELGFEDSHETNDIPLSDIPIDEGRKEDMSKAKGKSYEEGIQMDSAVGSGKTSMPEKPEKLRKFVWSSVRHLNLSWNELTSDALPDFWGEMFPNIELIDLSNNLVVGLEKVEKAAWKRLQNIDVSGNPLDCIKLNLDWIESGQFQLLHPNETMCDQPPHQNKPKPIFKVLPLIKNMREKCKLLKNCTCDIDYIYEKDHVVHSMTVVNCSGKGFLDFPNPAHLPLPTSTLDLTKNKIRSLATFVDNHEYMNLNVTNLYLDDNQISSINILEGSEWFYDFQVFSIRRNNLTEVPVYVLENVFRQNERLLQLDLSENKYRCDCFTVSSFKVWLLKYSSQIGNVDKVLCASTKEQVRYMRMETWCKMDSGAELIDVLDLVSIVLAILIIVVIAKVYYDYWNFKTKGKLPWIVSKM